MQSKIKDQQTRLDFPETSVNLVSTPCYLVSEDVLRRNCELLSLVRQRTGAKVLLALKAFALPAVFSLLRQYLDGVCASGPIEARLGFEEFGGEVHTYAPGFTKEQMERVVRFSDHVIFNSVNQFLAHRQEVHRSGRQIELGIRCNPGYAEVENDLYNPCVSGSRFGVGPKDLEAIDPIPFSGLHFHALCEQNSDVLQRVLGRFEKRFSSYIPRMRWVNFGGGHHVTREDYDVELLCWLINEFRARYNGIEVYLEPGEAVVLNGGVFVTSVVDIIDNGMKVVVLDCSAETHMPDVLAMPYRPHIVGSGQPGEYEYTYRLGGISCLAGDIIGDYSFPEPLRPGDRLVLTDMALYSFVKNTTFNGVELPSIYTLSLQEDQPRMIRQFGYEDYRSRIG